jgi:hypothetical protein
MHCAQTAGKRLNTLHSTSKGKPSRADSEEVEGSLARDLDSRWIDYQEIKVDVKANMRQSYMQTNDCYLGEDLCILLIVAAIACGINMLYYP